LSNNNLVPERVILIFPDSERQQAPLYAVWNKRNKKWYIITKSEEKEEEEDKINIRNAKEVLSPTEFVNALESGRYFLPRQQSMVLLKRRRKELWKKSPRTY
jgi:hypothetical protein